MRLRLTIRRHALPDTAIIWDAAEAQQLTISTLLEQINAVIPLESPADSWGLEDYAVELPGDNGSYECLHFQIVGKVFRDDDEVIIRPLLTPDVRMRRDSGRHQISADGMNLVDGIPFGRPRPLRGKTYNRPEVSIPPLKRRRITYDAEENEEEVQRPYHVDNEVGDRQLVLKAHFEDDDEEDDDDFDPEGVAEQEEDDEDEGEDDSDIRQDAEKVQLPEDGDVLMNDGHESDAGSDAAEEDNPTINYYDKHGLPEGGTLKGKKGLEHFAKAVEKSVKAAITSNRVSQFKAGKGNPRKRGRKVAFEAVRVEDTVEDARILATRKSGRNVEEENDLGLEMDDEDHTSDDSFDDDSDDDSPTDSSDLGDEDSDHGVDASTKAAKVDASEVQESSDSSSTSDSDSDSDSGSDADADAEDSGDVAPKSAEAGTSKVHDAEQDDESSYSSSSESGDEDSDSDSPRGAKPDSKTVKNAKSREDQSSDSASTSSSSSDSDSDSDSVSEPEEVSSKSNTSDNGTSRNVQKPVSQMPSEQAPEVPQQRTVPPGKGLKSTKARNIRRRNGNVMNRMKEKGIVPAGTSLDDFVAAGLRNVTSLEEAQEALKTRAAGKPEGNSKDASKSAKASKSAEFEARRKQLLESLASGEGVEVVPKSRRVQPPKAVSAGSGGVSELASTSPPNNIALADTEETPTAQRPLAGSRDTTLPTDQAGETSFIQRATPAKRADPFHPPLGRENCLQGLTFVFTGELESMNRNQCRQLVAKHGGRVLTNPTSKTDYVVIGSGVGPTKLSKIEKLKLKTIDQKGLSELIKKSTTDSGSALAGPIEEIPETPASDVASRSTSTAKKQTTFTAQGTPESGAHAHHAKLDIGAGRRMVFGALGLRNPKTKEDEDKIRSNLMQSARPVKAVEEPTVPEAQETDEDPDAWKANINLSAVECCHDDVVLSEPPFPFVQRWDPQQQGSWISNGGRGGKRKRKKRNNSDYYGNEHTDTHNERKRQKSWTQGDYEQALEDVMELNYDEPVQTKDDGIVEEGENEAPKPEEMNVDTQATDLDDLPSLPKDLSTLPKLNAGEAKVAMIIAFKHLIIGPNYQPQYSEYRTAIVIKITESEELELRLAKRDREQREYDPETGERIYGQFEMPVDDEDDDEEDDGFLISSFPELVEPLIVQEPPENLLLEESLSATNGADENPDDGNQGDGKQPTPDDAQGSQESKDTPSAGVKETPGEKQVSTDNSTTLDHDRAEDSPDKSIGTPLHQDSPVKSIENNPADKIAEEHTMAILTEDLLQKSAEDSLVEVDGEEENPAVERSSAGEKTHHLTLRGGEVTETDLQIEEIILEQASSRHRGQPTPRQRKETVNVVQVDTIVSEQESPRRVVHLVTPIEPLGGGDGEDDARVDDSELGKPNIEKNDQTKPRPSVRSNGGKGTESPPASITESARHDVSVMMREAGFRSEIPSSILRSQQLNVQNTLGDDAVSEKLLQQMAPDTQRIVYSSPKFKGSGSSSPIKARGERDLGMSPTPAVTWEKPTFGSPASISARPTSQYTNTEPSSMRYPRLQDLSSFNSQDVPDYGRQPDLYGADDPFHPSDEYDSLMNQQDEESSLIRAQADEFPSAQPRDSRSEAELEPAIELHDTPRAPLTVTEPISQPESPIGRSASPKPSPKLPENGPVPSSSNNVKKKKKKSRTPEPVSDFFPSSDSDNPDLAFVLSQPRIKSEPHGSQPLSQVPAKSNTAKYDAASSDGDMEDVKVPIPSQTLPKLRTGPSFSKKPNPRPTKEENRRASAPQNPRGLQAPIPPQEAPRPSQAPPRSQMIDLTLSSSPEPQFETAVEPDDENDSDYRYSGPRGAGWAPKRVTKRKSVEPAAEANAKARRVTSYNERVSSTQGAGGKAGAAGEGRRKTTSKF